MSRSEALLFAAQKVDDQWVEEFLRELAVDTCWLEKCRETVERRYAAESEARDGFSRIAYGLARMGRCAEAIEWYRRDWELDRMARWQMQRYVERLLTLGREREAERRVEQYYSKHAEARDGWAAIAWHYQQQSDFAAACNWFNRDRAEGRLSPVWFVRLAEAEANMGNWTVAESRILDAYAADQNVRDGFAKLGWIRYRAADSTAAMLLFEKDRENGRLSPAWHIRFAEVEASTGNLDAAESKVLEAYAADQSLRDGLARIAWIKNAAEDRKAAITLLEMDRATGRLSPATLLDYACLRAPNELALAEELVREAYAADPALRDGYARIGITVAGWKPVLSALPFAARDYREGRLSQAWSTRFAQAWIEDHYSAGEIDEYLVRLLNWLPRERMADLGRRLLECEARSIVPSDFIQDWLCLGGPGPTLELADLRLPADLEQEEAWLQSQPEETVDQIRVYFRQCAKAAENIGNMSVALEYLEKRFSAYHWYGNATRYDPDEEIGNQVRRYAENHPLQEHVSSRDRNRRDRTRIIYLLRSLGPSAIARVVEPFFKYYDRDKYEVAAALSRPASKQIIDASPLLKVIENGDVTLLGSLLLRKGDSTLDFCLTNAQAMKCYGADLLITTTLGVYERLICAYGLTPHLLNLVFGDEGVFTMPDSQHMICFDRRLESRLPGCVFVHPHHELPKRQPQPSRTVHGAQKDTFIIASAGRYHKYSNREYCALMLEILARFANTNLIIIGSPSFRLRSLQENALFPQMQDRITIMDRRPDYVDVLRTADMYLDTYPEGGGFTAMDAIAIGLPVVTFKSNGAADARYYELGFAESFGIPPELIVDRGDVNQLSRIVRKLMEDRFFRENMGRLCETAAHAFYSTPERMVAQCEAVFSRICQSGSHVKRELQ